MPDIAMCKSKDCPYIIQGYTQSQLDEIVDSKCMEFGDWLRNANFYYVASQPIEEIYEKFKKSKQK